MKIQSVYEVSLKCMFIPAASKQIVVQAPSTNSAIRKARNRLGKKLHLPPPYKKLFEIQDVKLLMSQTILFPESSDEISPHPSS